MSGGGGSSPSTTTTVNKTEPPPQIAPYLAPYVERGFNLSQQPYQAYGGQRFAGLTPEHEAALSATAQRATAGSPVMTAMQQNLAGTLRGDYLNPDSNPYLKQTFDRGAEQIRNQLTPSFGHMQAFGDNSGAQQAYGRSLADLATGMYGQNYQQERQRQLQGMLFAPQAAQADYQDAQALLGVGDIRREASQDQMNLAYEDWMRQQQWPYQQVNFAGDVLSRAAGGGGGSSSSTGPNPYRSNRTAGALGGAASGAALGSMVMPGIGTGIGALAGGLLGGFF